ncbi:hypothetical protein MTQ10_29450 [Streptomyces sp. XM83C]|jgi:hypothetical protein|uniref:Uncharacterized protein n=1 Tax=Streptomyces thermocoprophilus TaxID=78356 RepID=A0ABV5VNK9_9ACTN|nr:hypothetical protein [Streptomyces sp. XM83C]MCK1823599.1 hypothetical protein [Streptomyces sp. XM83C]
MTQEQARTATDTPAEGDRSRSHLDYRPSSAALAAAEAARTQLAASGAEVWVDPHWWGFEVYLNAVAAEDAEEWAGYIGEIVGAALPSPLGEITEVVCKLKGLLIREVGKTWGCKLVSPWIAPGMLVPVSLRPSEDTSLWWTVMTPGEGWNEDQRFTAHHSGSNPALAEFNGKLYLVHRGFSSPHDDLWWAVYDPETGWSEDNRFTRHMTSAGPALATFNGKLHCVHKGVGDDKRLFHTTFNGTSWSPDTPLPYQSTTGPALAVYNGRLHLVHKSGNNNEMWHATYDGSQWSADTRMPAHMTSANPALAVYQGRLHLVHKSGNNSELWHATYDGSRWSTDTRLPAHESLEGPGLAVLGDKLYCIHRGYGGSDQFLWWSHYNGVSWSADQKIGDHESGAGPAVINYRDKNAAGEQLLVVHRGYGKRAAGTDTAEMEALLAQEQRENGEPPLT